jgi:hypothetical protein
MANVLSRRLCPSGCNSTKRRLDNKLINYEIVAVLDSTRLLGRVITSDLKYDPTQQIWSKKDAVEDVEHLYPLYKKPGITSGL